MILTEVGTSSITPPYMKEPGFEDCLFATIEMFSYLYTHLHKGQHLKSKMNFPSFILRLSASTHRNPASEWLNGSMDCPQNHWEFLTRDFPKNSNLQPITHICSQFHLSISRSFEEIINSQNLNKQIQH